MFDIFYQWIMDAFTLLYFNSRLMPFVLLTSLGRGRGYSRMYVS